MYNYTAFFTIVIKFENKLHYITDIISDHIRWVVEKTKCEFKVIVSVTIPQSNSHTFLARILQKWYISDTICKNLARILDFRQTCQILAGQDISCKILGRILQDNVWNLKDILQENVWNVRETTRLFSNFKPGLCSNWMWMSRICSRADLNVTKNFKPSKNFEPRTKPSWKKLCDACR